MEQRVWRVSSSSPGTAGLPDQSDLSDLEEFMIKASDDGKTLDLAGADQRGNVYAVYDLLETLGCGFWSPDNETVPSETNLVLAAGYSKSEAPAFSYRNVDTPYAKLALTLKLRANAQRHRADVRERLTSMAATPPRTSCIRSTARAAGSGTAPTSRTIPNGTA
jgi:hypothetical protein